ncbi:MAG: DNA/RNA nuclease SfsA, partial [Candidatus Omnitrophica bacterium]|nr:DNA/RNA nuclease SfsA [Candidatus Omnitrophota bacterium]
LQEQLLPELKGWDLIKPEYKWGNSQFDFLLEKDGTQCLLEAKCCTYVVKAKGGLQNEDNTEILEARFPDAPTKRGTRHVRELIEARKQGYRSVIMILVQGVGAQRFRPNWETHPDFSDAFFEALDAGVDVFVRMLKFRGKRIYLGESIPYTRSMDDFVTVLNGG